MNYYEELGVAPTASAEEIRHAYKALARMVHPDQFPDENVKRLADLQMKRLNQMLSVLNDPEQRLRYNLMLNGPPVAMRRGMEHPLARPAPDRRPHPLTSGLAAWLLPGIGLILLCGAVMYYFSSETSEAAAIRSAGTEERAAAPDTTPLFSKAERLAGSGFADPGLPAKPRATQQDQEASPGEQQKPIDRFAGSNRPSAAEESSQEPPVASRLTPAEIRVAAMAARAETSEHSVPATGRLAGHWYYVPEPRQAAAVGIYLPEYIELRVTEDGGTLRGRYRARYRVTDQAISPEVTFQFEGAGGLPAASLPWTGPGGARGKVALRLVSADQLEVTWTAGQLSADLNLASGTAQLIRQREPR